ncbi:hypothetical protein PNOK_0072700 [Pyrrhoderma noxium]|uniref:DUF676 domain-containing protein n=1 Tax=Pyrrhoderma noxium TaxID=2282107 RepID=A0A286UVN0_9AGAM|nr:hypothetical protein PNOK_0072700 [Pyrrhoderma noxium]
MNRIIQETKGSGPSDEGVELDVLVAEANRDQSTYDGIDWGGERVADEIADRVGELEASGKKVIKFSITGYSLGGLVSRYVIGILHQRGFFKEVKPVNFTTFATPHIGLVRTGSIFSSIAFALGPKLLSRTGTQFYAVDSWGESGRCLLEVMADPKAIFYQALSQFPHIRIYGNAVNDRTVPYVTSLIESTDPFVNRSKTGINVEFDPKYDPIMTDFSIPDTPPKQEKIIMFSPKWFRSLKSGNILPPPLSRLKFPLNFFAVILLPVLVPTFLTLVVVRLSLHARSSRSRVRLLEGDEKRRENALIHAISKFEFEIEEAVISMMEDDRNAQLARPIDNSVEKDDTSNRVLTVSEAREIHSSSAANSGKGKAVSKDGQPTLSPSQLLMVQSLNSLPQMTKYKVYIDPTLNSHATIVSRDVKAFEFHKRGWGTSRSATNEARSLHSFY